MTTSSFTSFSATHGSIGVRSWPGDEAAPVAVMIHGVDGSSEGWDTVALGLAATHRVIALDLRGRGGAAMSGPWGVAAHAEDVASFVATLEAPVILVGHSFGGHVVARVTADQPDAVSNLALIDGGPPRVIPDGMTPEQLAEGALANIVPNLESKGASVDAVTADFHSMVSDEIATRAVFDATCAITLLRAELGVAPTLPPVVPDAVVSEMTDAGLEVDDQIVAGATHFSVLGDHAGPVIDRLARLSPAR